ncbi:MAG: hypothetical protein NTY63_08260 [Candidatus Bipolaricaulota bacterium]|nr:hypothetical protein [Candidatus Bipolaricaulota bacterium]
MREQEVKSPLELYIEAAPNGDALIHAPRLPGFSVKVARGSSRDCRMRAGLTTYARWLAAHDLATASCAAVLRNIQWLEVEAVPGAPVWISGNAAALFSVDRRPLSDSDANARLDVVAAAISDMAAATMGLSARERVHGCRTGGRSIDEALTHVGNCVWWYASRIDDELPEPPEFPGESPLARCVRLLADVRPHLLSVSGRERTRVHVPTRFPTNDSSEAWTYAKVCRREAEHAWDHVDGVRRAAAATRRARTSRAP